MNTIHSSNPVRPDVHPGLVMEWRTARPARTIVHEPLYGAPVVTIAPLGARRGRLRLFFATATAAAACYAMHAEPAVLTLTAPISDLVETLRYVVAGGDLELTVDPATALRTILEVPYQEVPA